MTSDEGLNAYGAATWGQFFIYQGFNDRLGWMHTSSGVDNVDFFLETTVVAGAQRCTIAMAGSCGPCTANTVDDTLPHGGRRTRRARSFTVYRTHHGPVIRQTWAAGGSALP